MRINDITQPCALSGLSKSGAPVVRAITGTDVSFVETQVSATRASLRAAGCAGAESLPQVSFGWRSLELSSARTSAGVSAVAGAGVVEAVEVSGHRAVQAVSKLALKQVASLAGVGLEVRRPVVVDGERPATSARLAALVADGRGGRLMQDQHKQQDQFGSTGVGIDGYAFGSAANGTNPIDPRDFRTSSPPG